MRHWRIAQLVDVKQDHAASTWAEGVSQLVEEDFPEAPIAGFTLVMDNLNTHNGRLRG